MKRFFSLLVSSGLIGVILYGVLFIRPYSVSGDSMTPILADKTLILVDTLQARIGRIKRGDIVVYVHEKTPKIKRIVGLEKETLIIKDGAIYHDNETKLSEPYLRQNVRTCVPGSCIDIKPRSFIVPEKSYFILGDNRENSRDSRGCADAISCDAKDAYSISSDDIIGKYLFRLPFLK